jgi:protein O-mannosyl-transferase
MSQRETNPNIWRFDWRIDLALVVLVLLVHGNGVNGKLIFDDVGSIVDNPSIRDLADLPNVLFGGTFTTVVNRPVLNFSLAVNYALGQTSPWGYHVFNIVLHALNVLLVARLAQVMLWAPGRGPVETVIWSGLAASLWAVHPLTTAAVVYIVQRAEALMSLFYLAGLLSLVASVRAGQQVLADGESDDSDHSREVWWWMAATVCFLLGLATKEVAITLPVIALVLDRTYLAATWSEVFRNRWRGYLTLMFISVAYAVFVLFISNGRGGTAGLSVRVLPVDYLTTQFVIVADYLWYSIWPVCIPFDWGIVLITSPADWGPPLAILIPLLLLSLVGAACGSRWTFPGAWLLLILAPTSTVVPIATQVGALHRMYLPLVGLTIGVCGLVSLARFPCWAVSARPTSIICRSKLAVTWLLVAALSVLTAQRSALFVSPLAVWKECARCQPLNPRSFNNVAALLREQGQLEDALKWATRALEIAAVQESVNASVADSVSLSERGVLYYRLDKLDLALRDFDAAIQRDPNYDLARINRADLLLDLGHPEEAIAECDRLIARRFRLETTISLRGIGCLHAGRLQEAELCLRLLDQLNLRPTTRFRKELDEARAAAARPSTSTPAPPAPPPPRD